MREPLRGDAPPARRGHSPASPQGARLVICASSGSASDEGVVYDDGTVRVIHGDSRQDLGRHAVLIDTNAAYCELAASAMSQEVFGLWGAA